jgi:hypothetical protein
MGPQSLPRVAGAIVTSVVLVLLAYEADHALRTQLARVRAPAGSTSGTGCSGCRCGAVRPPASASVRCWPQPSAPPRCG